MIPWIIIDSDITKRTEQILKILEGQGLKKNHPNMFWVGEGEKLGIEQSKKVINHLSLRPYQSGGQAVVIIEAENLTPEAQNALLKTLEEPPVDAIILLGAASEDNFLSTVLSRCQIVNSKLTTQILKLEDPDKVEIERLINSSIEARFQHLEKLEDKQKLLDNITIYYQEKFINNPAKLQVSLLEDLIQAHRWAKQNVNLRAILEYIMLRAVK